MKGLECGKGRYITREKQYQEIGYNLRQQIMDGQYPIGSRLPPERQLAEAWGSAERLFVKPY